MSAILKQVKDAIRHPVAWPGGYSKLVYMDDGEPLCPPCARENYRAIVYDVLYKTRFGWTPIGVDVHWEGPDEVCAHCGKTLPSEYGDPDAPEGEE